MLMRNIRANFMRRKVKYSGSERVLCCFILVGLAIIGWFIAGVVDDEDSSIAPIVTRPSSPNPFLFTCRLVQRDPFHPSLKEKYLSKADSNPKDGCKNYYPVTNLTDGFVTIARNGSFTCTARCLFYVNEEEYRYDEWVAVPTKEEMKCDMIETYCEDAEHPDQPPEMYIHMQIYEIKDEVVPIAVVEKRPDVHIILLDSVSSSMLTRSLGKTKKYLAEKMGAVDFKFLNKVGRNSKPNGFPLFFGKSVEKIDRSSAGMANLEADWDEDKICNDYMDEYEYIPEEYRKSGYKTYTAQDYSITLVKYENCYGLKRNEADHMWRQFWLRLREEKKLKKIMEGKDVCSESHHHMLYQLQNFIRAYNDTPKYSVSWFNEVAHDSVTIIYHTDAHFLKFFQDNEKQLNNSFIIFLADHGPRFDGILDTEVGRYELQNPMLMVTVPSFLRNTPIHKKLKEKELQLLTHFDVHATMFDILMFQPHIRYEGTEYEDFSPLSKGSSLFRDFKENEERNCATLPIPTSYCLCQFDTKNVSEPYRTKLGHIFSEKLAEIIKNSPGEDGDLCVPQTLFKVKKAEWLVNSNPAVYSVIVQMQPSNGSFSATFRQTGPDSFDVLGEIERLDEYAKQAGCGFFRHFEHLCYCSNKYHPSSPNATNSTYL